MAQDMIEPWQLSVATAKFEDFKIITYGRTQKTQYKQFRKTKILKTDTLQIYSTKGLGVSRCDLKI